VLRDCPYCAGPLPAEAHPGCPGCGLVWGEVTDRGWELEVRDAPPVPSPLPIVRQLSLFNVGCVWMILFPFAMLPPALVYRFVTRPPVASGPLFWLAVVLVSLAGLALFAFCVTGCLLVLFGRVEPERIDVVEQGLRLRVHGHSLFGRTDLFLHRSSISGVARRDAGRDSGEVWLIHTSGAALRVISTATRADAEELQGRISAWLDSSDRARLDHERVSASGWEGEEGEEATADAAPASGPRRRRM
jgi:hypothetical protein